MYSLLYDVACWDQAKVYDSLHMHTQHMHVNVRKHALKHARTQTDRAAAVLTCWIKIPLRNGRFCTWHSVRGKRFGTGIDFWIEEYSGGYASSSPTSFSISPPLCLPWCRRLACTCVCLNASLAQKLRWKVGHTRLASRLWPDLPYTRLNTAQHTKIHLHIKKHIILPIILWREDLGTSLGALSYLSGQFTIQKSKLPCSF